MKEFEVIITKKYCMTVDAETEDEANEIALNLIEHHNWYGKVVDTWIQSQI